MISRKKSSELLKGEEWECIFSWIKKLWVRNNYVFKKIQKQNVLYVMYLSQILSDQQRSETKVNGPWKHNSAYVNKLHNN